MTEHHQTTNIVIPIAIELEQKIKAIAQQNRQSIQRQQDRIETSQMVSKSRRILRNNSVRQMLTLVHYDFKTF